MLAANRNASGERATLGDCRGSVQNNNSFTGTERCNLYIDRGGNNSFIASVSAADLTDWETVDPYGPTARVTADGSRLAFDSVRSLTGFDNRRVDGAACEKNRVYEQVLSACNEVYLYDAGTDKLVCASCDPTGGRPTAGARIMDSEAGAVKAGGSWEAGTEYLPRNLSADGRRLFFETADGLVAGDHNGKQDIYEWEQAGTGGCASLSAGVNVATGGCISLISSGTNSTDSAFLDASPSGNDVFFETAAQLVGQDHDQQLDVYDARVGGAVAEAPTTACTGSGCQGIPPAPPSFATPSSLTFNGIGNFPLLNRATLRSSRCKHGFVKKHNKCGRARTRKKRLPRKRAGHHHRRTGR